MRARKPCRRTTSGEVLGPDEDRAAGARLDQHDAAQDQRAHDAVAELGLRDHHGPQVLCRDEQRLHVVDGVRVDQRRPAGELPQLGREVTGALLDDGGEMPQRIAPRHPYATGSEHEGSGSDFPRHEQRLILGVALHLAEADQPVDLPGSELREHSFITRIDARHGFSRPIRRLIPLKRRLR